jgi:hypothetical protein
MECGENWWDGCKSSPLCKKVGMGYIEESFVCGIMGKFTLINY